MIQLIMRLIFLLILILSTAYALTVVTDPYKYLPNNFDDIEVYDYNDNDRSNGCICDCGYYGNY